MSARCWRCAASSLLALLGAACGAPPHHTAVPLADHYARRTVVLGFDGMDPKLTERWMSEGKLPNFARLAASGFHQDLRTTTPPQSPVAWSSFATGRNPGEHGVFDFLRRNAADLTLDFSIAQTVAPKSNLDVFGWRLPLEDPVVRTRRQGTPFWIDSEEAGIAATVQRVPVTYPPDPIRHMLSGMGVPDLLGTQGSYTLYANHVVPDATEGGRVRLLRADADGVIRTALEGPTHPLAKDQHVLKIAMEIHHADAGIKVRLGSSEIALTEGQWSDWIPLKFSYLGPLGIPGMVRLHLNRSFPRLELYVSPIQVDPLDPALQISAPTADAAAMAGAIGRFHTLGMPEETWSLNQGHLDEQGFLDTIKTTLAEGQAMLNRSLDAGDSGLIVHVFVQTDRVSHMFWRGLDPTHPLYAESSALARGAIPWIYGEADRILGETMARLGPEDQLIVLSDHGFASFARAVHLNRWLIDAGYLALKPGHTESGPLFEAIDWEHTRAYAAGLNGIYFNLRGREVHGIVAAEDAQQLGNELIEKLMALRDPDRLQPVVLGMHRRAEVYQGRYAEDAADLIVGYAPGYRASWQTALGGAPLQIIVDNRQLWSGDHCIEASAVPGVLFGSRPPAKPIVGIEDIAAWIATTRPPITGNGPH